MAGTDDANFFAGSVRIGTTTPTDALHGEVMRRAGSQGWRVIKAHEDEMAFDRAYDGRYERVDLRWSRGSTCVGLSYVQASARDAQAFERSSEGDWTRKELWPVLERAAANLDKWAGRRTP